MPSGSASGTSTPRAEKHRRLDEVVAVTGMHRKAAIRLLRRRPGARPTPGPGGRPRLYGPEIAAAAEVLWQASGRIGAHRLQPFVPELLDRLLVVGEPGPANVEQLTPPELSAKDRLLVAAASVAHATHFVTGDVADFGRFMDHRTRLPLQVMTPRQFLTEVRALRTTHSGYLPSDSIT